jgi:hypothetical protein
MLPDLEPDGMRSRLRIRPSVALARVSRALRFPPLTLLDWSYRLRPYRDDDDELPMPFAITSSETEYAAVQPRTVRLKLRPNQLRSLHWMQRRERHLASTPGSVTIAETILQHPVSHLTAEYRLRLTSGLRGGILADPIGFGKTAVALSLVATTLSPPNAQLTTKSLLSSRATLVIVPSHLIGQWLGEAKKFYGTSLGAIAIQSVNDVKKLSTERLYTAGLVVVSQALFGSPKYLDLIWAAAGARDPGDPTQEAEPPARKKRKAAGVEPPPTPAEVEEEQRARAAKGLRDAQAQERRYLRAVEALWRHADLVGAKNVKGPLPLELFYWSRLVVDEVHTRVHMHTNNTCTHTHTYTHTHAHTHTCMPTAHAPHTHHNTRLGP